MGARDSVLVGSSGEHYILYRLQRKGILAALAPANAYAADILVFSPAMSVGSLVQVKTRTTGADGGWHMSEKHERLSHDRLFYAFLDLEPQEPVVFIIPCAVVQKVVFLSHSTWLAIPGANGRVHRDSNVRRLRGSYQWEVPGFGAGWLDEWRERWDLLEVDPTHQSAMGRAGG